MAVDDLGLFPFDVIHYVPGLVLTGVLSSSSSSSSCSSCSSFMVIDDGVLYFKGTGWRTIA